MPTIRVSRFLWIAALGSFVLLSSVQAQNPAPPPAVDVLRTNIELVQTDVTVVDRQGKFVDSLQPEQFTLTVDGHNRPIALISRVTQSTAGTRIETQPTKATPDRSAHSEVVSFYFGIVLSAQIRGVIHK